MSCSQDTDNHVYFFRTHSVNVEVPLTTNLYWLGLRLSKLLFVMNLQKLLILKTPQIQRQKCQQVDTDLLTKLWLGTGRQTVCVCCCMYTSCLCLCLALAGEYLHNHVFYWYKYKYFKEVFTWLQVLHG